MLESEVLHLENGLRDRGIDCGQVLGAQLIGARRLGQTKYYRFQDPAGEQFELPELTLLKRIQDYKDRLALLRKGIFVRCLYVLGEPWNVQQICPTEDIVLLRQENNSHTLPLAEAKSAQQTTVLRDLKNLKQGLATEADSALAAITKLHLIHSRVNLIHGKEHEFTKLLATQIPDTFAKVLDALNFEELSQQAASWNQQTLSNLLEHCDQALQLAIAFQLEASQDSPLAKLQELEKRLQARLTNLRALQEMTELLDNFQKTMHSFPFDLTRLCQTYKLSVAGLRSAQADLDLINSLNLIQNYFKKQVKYLPTIQLDTSRLSATLEPLNELFASQDLNLTPYLLSLLLNEYQRLYRTYLANC